MFSINQVEMKNQLYDLAKNYIDQIIEISIHKQLSEHER